MKKLFDFDAEFKLGIEEVDREHVRLVEMLNEVHTLISEGQKESAQKYFNETLSAYVVEHFDNEERFMEQIGFPQLEEHRKIHANFKKSFQELQPSIATFDDDAFRKALGETFAWIISHIGRTDRKYANFYLSQRTG